ncbi:MAG: YtxH domain-containing protein [Pedobacter sp.]|uniref:YtxH domain-containing protein n=1 Tax=Pedobacter sp. TaxID=1411316 RepID=UPI0035624B6A
MNYRKIIQNTIQTQKDHSLTAFALLAGLAAGSALAVLFAPKSGRESRKLLAEKLRSGQPTHQDEMEEHLFDDLRETTREHAAHLQGPESKRKDPTSIKIPSAGTTAWKDKALTE